MSSRFLALGRWLAPLVAIALWAGCQSAPVEGVGTAGVVAMRNNTARPDPDIANRYPWLDRLALYALDGIPVREEVVELSDLAGVEPGDRLLTFVGTDTAGRSTLSHLRWQVEPGVRYFLRPLRLDDGRIVAQLARSRYGEVIATASTELPDELPPNPRRARRPLP